MLQGSKSLKIVMTTRRKDRRVQYWATDHFLRLERGPLDLRLRAVDRLLRFLEQSQ